MIKEAKLAELAAHVKNECKRVDFKSSFDPKIKGEWCEIIKDVVSMANSGGGAIVFGASDKGEACDFDINIVLDIDPADVSNKIKSYTGEDFSDFNIITVKRGLNNFAAILISATEIPLVFTRPGDYTVAGVSKTAFHRGTVYFRHGAKSEPGNTNDIRIAINRSIDNKHKEWFAAVKTISKMHTGEEVIVRPKLVASQLSHSQRTQKWRPSAVGKPVSISIEEFKKLQKSFPLDYYQVRKACRDKYFSGQKRLQAYINRCKKTDGMAFNWLSLGKNTGLPFPIPDRYTYSQKVIDAWSKNTDD